MKSIFSFLTISLLIGLMCSCGGDDDCMPGTFESNLVGTWDTPSLNPSVPEGTVDFTSGMVGSTTESSAFDRGDLEFTWLYDDTDSTLFIGPYIYEMLNFECDKIELSTVGANFTITRQ